MAPTALNQPSPALAGAAAVVGMVGDLAASQGRDDLVAELAALTAGLGVRPVDVLVIGGPGQGKSSVVNALLGAPICPTGPGGTTVVDTAVRWAPAYEALAWREPATPESAPDHLPLAYDEALALATASTNPDNAWQIRCLDIGAPAPATARGLTLIDTPPVHHVWCGSSARLAMAMARAAAVMLVTNAAGPLTSGELDLLRVAASSCSRVVVVVNGTASYAGWRSIVEQDELLLERRGVPATVIAVDAAPYWSPAGGLSPGPDPGMRRLATHLAETVVLEREQTRISRALTEAFWAADRLRLRLQAERALIGDDDAITRAMASLEDAGVDAATLCGPEARWRRELDAGVAQLRRDIEADLAAERARLTEELTGGDAAADPVRFHARLADAVAHLQRMRTLALRALAQRVSSTFHHDAAQLSNVLPLTADAHAIGLPRLDQPVVAERVGMERLALATRTAPDATPGAWLTAALDLVAAEAEQAIQRTHAALADRCGGRAIELHRSLVEVRTAVQVLRGADAGAVLHRQQALAAELERLATVDWQVLPG